MCVCVCVCVCVRETEVSVVFYFFRLYRKTADTFEKIRVGLEWSVMRCVVSHILSWLGVKKVQGLWSSFC